MIPVFHPCAQVSPAVEGALAVVMRTVVRSEGHEAGLPKMGYVRSTGRPRDLVAEEKRRLFARGVSKDEILRRCGGSRQALDYVLRRKAISFPSSTPIRPAQVTPDAVCPQVMLIALLLLGAVIAREKRIRAFIEKQSRLSRRTSLRVRLRNQEIRLFHAGGASAEEIMRRFKVTERVLISVLNGDEVERLPSDVSERGCV